MKEIIIVASTSGENSSIPIDDDDLELKCLIESYMNATNEENEVSVFCVFLVIYVVQDWLEKAPKSKSSFWNHKFPSMASLALHLCINN